MRNWKRPFITTMSLSILLTQGVPLPYLAHAMEASKRLPVNGEVKFSWKSSNQVALGSTFNPYDGLESIDSDGDNVAMLTQVSGEVDTAKVGIYPITYSIQNVDGETFSLIRNVEVVELTNIQDDMMLEDTSHDEQEIQQAIETEIENIEENNPNQQSNQELREEEEEGLLAEEHSISIDSEISSLNDVLWTISERTTNQCLFQLKLNTKSGKYEIQISN